MLPSSPIQVPTSRSAASSTSSTSSTSSQQSGGGRKSFVGTAEYVSPEVLRDQRAEPASDLWAIGCILFQMISGTTPFKAATEYLIFQAILKCEVIFPTGFNPIARDLISKLLLLDPLSRLGANSEGLMTLKAHPFFSGIDFASLATTPVPDLPPLPSSTQQRAAEEIPSGESTVMNRSVDWLMAMRTFAVVKLLITILPVTDDKRFSLVFCIFLFFDTATTSSTHSILSHSIPCQPF